LLRASRQFDKNDKMITIKARRRYCTTKEWGFDHGEEPR
jgi:hypothetical protein